MTEQKYDQTTGDYVGTEQGINGYSGEWIEIDMSQNKMLWRIEYYPSCYPFDIGWTHDIFDRNLHNQPRKWRMYASTDKVNWTVVADEDNYNNHDWRDPLFEFYGGSRAHKRYNDLSGHLIDRPNPVKIPKHYTKDLSNGVLCRYFRMTVQDISGEYTGEGTNHQGTTHKGYWIPGSIMLWGKGRENPDNLGNYTKIGNDELYTARAT